MMEIFCPRAVKRSSPQRRYSTSCWLENDRHGDVHLALFYHAPMCKGVLINLDDGTTLRIEPFLNKEGEPELLIGCVTEETVGEVYQWVSNYD